MSDYQPYFPLLLEAWDRKDYDVIFSEIAQDYCKTVVFCVDLSFHGNSQDLIQLACEFAKYDGVEIDTKKLVKVVQECLQKLDDGMASHDGELCDEVAKKLLEGSKSQLVTFASSLLYSDDRTQGIYKCGYLSGNLAKLQKND